MADDLELYLKAPTQTLRGAVEDLRFAAAELEEEGRDDEASFVNDWADHLAGELQRLRSGEEAL